MPAPYRMFQREQIPIDPNFAAVLKAWQKDTYKYAGERTIPLLEAVEFAREWFSVRDREYKERLAREEAWRREWSGRKGQILQLFQRIDTNQNGTLSQEELSSLLEELSGDFFGFSKSGSDTGLAEVSGWLQDEFAAGNLGAKALFSRLDRNHDGAVQFEEFYEVLCQWLDSGFDRIEELRAQREARKREAERAAKERADREAREAAEVGEREPNSQPSFRLPCALLRAPARASRRLTVRVPLAGAGAAGGGGAAAGGGGSGGRTQSGGGRGGRGCGGGGAACS